MADRPADRPRIKLTKVEAGRYRHLGTGAIVQRVGYRNETGDWMINMVPEDEHGADVYVRTFSEAKSFITSILIARRWWISDWDEPNE